ncbi:hypothetical protein GUITHDRAFT_103937 [Guillardia theta CCMP2712]|uniref:Uncharacterized protein n=1 Tax=Guillardia theta (strain CCMP2712) TaxID=905079 RepID=L1JPX1_GUITC|nr:hypothetical protein GUITHDRAFT_103937 [Guillardia theta CCMP2712]EKX50123.1 hypothetical protein GUITHDRAFT_103937 [Guillardia theta CCMP2712]|eukprot:XP_005837103.1 hypothetical protein GUITHDRAFT_103937 [Guillardia theta CCMP2712]
MSYNLTHVDSCPAGDCVLPVDANISVSSLGVGNDVSVYVSIDLYPIYSVAGINPAIYHSNTQLKYTIIRVIFPYGFNVSNSVVNISGGGRFGEGVTGLEGITNRAGFIKIAPSSKGSLTIEPAVTDNVLVGTWFGSSDPCSSTSCTNMFEMMTYSDTDADVQSSDVRGTIQRIHFTISGVVNPLYTPGEIPGALQQRKVQFGIQIFDATDELRGTTKVPSYKMKFYNNRINDPQLNRMTHYWFSRTGNTAVILTRNKLSYVNLSLSTPLSSQLTSAQVTFKTVTGIPVGGSIFVKFPSTFKLPPFSNVLATVNGMKGANTSVSVKGTSFLRDSTSILLYRIQNAIGRKQEITLNITSVLTPSDTVSGPVQVESWNVMNVTLDYGTSNEVELRPQFLASVYPHCQMQQTWDEIMEGIRRGNQTHKSGGLGDLMILNKFEVWVCSLRDACAKHNISFCYVFDEQKKMFVPWGLADELMLV